MAGGNQAWGWVFKDNYRKRMKVWDGTLFG